jgi:hypothetical protein
VLLTGEATRPVNVNKNSSCATVRIQEINDLTEFYLKGRVAPTTPFVSEEPQAAAVPTAPVPNNARERQSSNNVTSNIEGSLLHAVMREEIEGL